MKVLFAEIAKGLRPRSARAALLQVVGMGAIAFGAGMIYRPAGFIVGGVALLALAWLSE